MIQPCRIRTPLPYIDHDDASAETVSSPATPRRKVRPKLSSYFSQYIPATGHGKHEPLNADHTCFDVAQISASTYTWPGFCQPDPEVLMESIMRKLLADPFQPTDARDNSSLMMIFEAYRSLRGQNMALCEELKNEGDCRYAGEMEAERAEKIWQQEREGFRAEIKRLELLIVKGKRGMADVMRARQDSMLRKARKRQDLPVENDSKETVFEFLERTRAEDEDARQSQRGVLFQSITDTKKR